MIDVGTLTAIDHIGKAAVHEVHRVHIDLSGWSPKYFPPQLVQYANSLLQGKVLFGPDNAAGLLGLTGGE